MKKQFDIEKWIKENEERQQRVNEMLKKNPLCERCHYWNPYGGCDSCR